MLCGCDHPAVSIHRTATLLHISAYIASLVPHSLSHNLASAYRTLLDPLSFNEPHMVWAGTLTPAHLAALQAAITPVTDVIHPSHPVYTTLKKLSGIVLHGSLAILSARHSASSRMAFHRRRLYHRPSTTETYHRNSYRPPPRTRRACPTSLSHCLRPFPLHSAAPPSVPIHSLPSTPLPSPPSPSAPSPLISSPPRCAPSITRPTRPIGNLRPRHTKDFWQQSIDKYLQPSSTDRSITLHSHTNLGTRAIIPTSDHRLFRTAQVNPTDPSVTSALTLPISSASLSHLVSNGAAGWLCDLTISRIADIANAQLSSGQLSYYCLDGTFFSQLCQRRHDSYVLCYAAVRARFEDWLEDRHPLNRSLICIPTNTTGSHWNGAFIFLDQRTILHVDSTKRDSLQASRRVITALRTWLEWETEQIASRPYNSSEFQAKLDSLKDLSTWQYSCRTSPLQTNGNDCGVFYLMNLIYTLLSSSFPSRALSTSSKGWLICL